MRSACCWYDQRGGAALSCVLHCVLCCAVLCCAVLRLCRLIIDKVLPASVLLERPERLGRLAGVMVKVNGEGGTGRGGVERRWGGGE